ncbi:hypothetical protein Goari_010431 [Gossypium aridum]|uniref:Cytochrome c oxidase copper chaperone n=1 Tax=Gossypium aridum TaxID=34290 RepID=A0A7J8Y027_GOSAI|nr:hypothetical protein [Gossypium aridum]
MDELPTQSTSAVALPRLQLNRGSTTATSGPESKPKKKICCACPETKKLRDECIVEHGEEACAKWIEAHRICLRAEGFNGVAFSCVALCNCSDYKSVCAAAASSALALAIVLCQRLDHYSADVAAQK